MRDGAGRVLNVRKRGTQKFMLPGGKPEPGETPKEAVIREFHEELGVALDPSSVSALGEFRAAAANEPGFEVVAHVFEHPLIEGVQARAEIDAVEWIDPSEEVARSRSDLAPLNTDHIFPALRAPRPSSGSD